jgi:hypothetical protein
MRGRSGRARVGKTLLSTPSVPSVRASLLPPAALALAALALLAFSQTLAWYGDEGFHLLAASLVGAGRIPYRDFFYQHPPLFPYLYAGWMQIAGETWRSAHLLSGLLTAAMFWLVVDYVRSRHTSGGVPLALFAVAMLATNLQLLKQATVGHPYALSALLAVLAFRLILHAMRRSTSWPAFLAGAAAGGAACASLLAAPLVAVVALWLLLARRAVHALCFLAGAALWLAPLAWFHAQAPEAVFFDLIEYHLFYRGPSYRVPPPLAYLEGLEKLYLWLRSVEGLPRSVLALIAIGWLFRRDAANGGRRSELVLAAAIAAGMLVFASTAYPVFSFYFVLAIPFLTILACHGAWRIAGTKWIVSRQPLFFSLLALVLAAALARNAIWNSQLPVPPWRGLEQITALLDSAVPPAQPVYADQESIYFVARRLPLPGLENSFGSELELWPGQAAALKVVPQARIDDWIRGGRFAAVWMHEYDPRVESLSLASLYARRARIVTDSPGLLFWERVSQPPPAAASAARESPSNVPDAAPASR